MMTRLTLPLLLLPLMPAVGAEMTTVEREVVTEARTRVEFLAAEEHRLLVAAVSGARD